LNGTISSHLVQELAFLIATVLDGGGLEPFCWII
jgi:hypothetical protein